MSYSFTPKAGLLSMIASCLLRVKYRVYNIVGMPLMEAKSIKMTILKLVERVTYTCATHLFTNSYGLREYIKENLTKREIDIIYNGSINGVDIDYFKDSFSKLKKRRLEITWVLNNGPNGHLVWLFGGERRLVTED